MSGNQDGLCCICGLHGKLSFEHVPPRAAFNDQRIFEANIDTMLKGKWSVGERPTEGRYAQRGSGRYSLCNKCNNDTGSWYGASYVEVAKRAMTLLYMSSGNLSLAYPYSMWPLRFLKQIVVMFFSACGPELQKGNPALVRFVLNKEEQQFPDRIKIYAYLHHPTKSSIIRQSGLSGVVTPSGAHVFSEIAFPPFGLILSIDRPPIDRRLCELTHLAEHRFSTKRDVYLKLPVFPVTTPLPGDFRTEEDVRRDMVENNRLGSLHLNQPIPELG